MQFFKTVKIVHSRKLPPKELMYPVLCKKKKYFRVKHSEDSPLWIDIPYSDVVSIKVYASPFNKLISKLLGQPVKNKNYRLGVIATKNLNNHN